METVNTYHNHDASIDQEALVDRFNSFMDVIDAVKDVYDEGLERTDSATRSLLERDLARTKMARDRVLDEMIFNAVHCATKVPLIDGDDDPTLLDFTKVMGILFAKATTRLKPIMGHANLAAALRELAQRLDDGQFDGETTSAVMSTYIDHAAVTREQGEDLEF